MLLTLTLKPALLAFFAVFYYICILVPVRLLAKRYPDHWLFRERGSYGRTPPERH